MKPFISKLAFLGIIAVSLLGFTSCNEDNSGPFDAITKKVSLSATYTGKDFLSEGIGSATLSKATDGDTANFKLSSGTSVTIRFYGIDTPESTGSVDKWGKAASKFTAEKLENAKDIVLEASTTPASHDSYGTRYLGYVWYRTSDDDPFKNLNLEIVENGYSENKCLQTAAYKYYNAFKEAQEFAKGKKMHIWGNDVDPYYSTEATVLTIKELKENIDSYYNIETDSGSKVRFTAVVTSLELGGAGSNVTYNFVVQQFCDGEPYTYRIYAGYSTSLVALNILVGNEYTFTGTVQKHDSEYQLSGLTYVFGKKGGDFLTLTKESAYVMFNTTNPLKTAKYIEPGSLYSNLTVTAAVVEGNTIKLTATAYQLSKTASDSKTFTIIVPKDSSVDVSTLVGKTVKCNGFQNTVNQIEVINYSDLKIN